ncbi:polysaccharide biosynthesis C-terminal domain-containing protein [Laribacter hongkongensis]|uniref:lipopolysaccharide biosynthesis protein n=1 Tax=Laribacter hongkongensis TaxID=168471 RepID=UPI001EFCA4CD|nr:polysaccharide biosynthesis C-terminal domain-containing protein [Laribacter hongkongensis]MCG9059543.1 polysaccharide biosynthesis C-terminal domain-containing protein [Laribacter hongkongensis]MCG9086581.1 polysaccharide biosynthesis C-terminal domain-containing protein [Laribacter hongkongensis]
MRAFAQVFSFDLLSKVLLGGLGIVLIRYMPAGEYATYTLLLSLVAVVTQGISATFNRIYILAGEKGAGDAWPALGLQGMLIVLLAALGLPLIASLGVGYGVALALVVANCASEFAKTCYQRELAFARFSLIEISRSALFVAIALLLIWTYGDGVTAYSIVSVQAASLLFVAWFALRGRLAGSSASLAGSVQYALRLADRKYLGLFAYFAVVGLFTQADIFMLKIVGDESMLSTYGSAFRYYSILSLALSAVHAVLLPMIQRSGGSADLLAILARHRRLLLLFAGSTALAAWLSGWFIPWIDAGKYPQATATFRVLCISAIISFAFSPHANLLLRYEAFKFLALAVVAALITHVALCFVLIPSHGAVGAAISTAISAALANAAFYLRAHQLTLRVAAA